MEFETAIEGLRENYLAFIQGTRTADALAKAVYNFLMTADGLSGNEDPRMDYNDE